MEAVGVLPLVVSEKSHISEVRSFHLDGFTLPADVMIPAACYASLTGRSIGMLVASPVKHLLFVVSSALTYGVYICIVQASAYTSNQGEL